MCILSNPTAAVPTTPPAAQTLPPQTRRQLALEALAGASITDLANHHRCSVCRTLYATNSVPAMNRKKRAELAVWARPLTIYSVTQKRLILNHAYSATRTLGR